MQVGSGWQIFDKVITPGDSDADGDVDTFAREHNGALYRYPTDGLRHWKSPSMVGPEWDVQIEISGEGVLSPNWGNYHAARGPRNGVIGIDPEGDLQVYSPDFGVGTGFQRNAWSAPAGTSSNT